MDPVANARHQPAEELHVAHRDRFAVHHDARDRAALGDHALARGDPTSRAKETDAERDEERGGDPHRGPDEEHETDAGARVETKGDDTTGGAETREPLAPSERARPRLREVGLVDLLDREQARAVRGEVRVGIVERFEREGDTGGREHPRAVATGHDRELRSDRREAMGTADAQRRSFAAEGARALLHHHFIAAHDAPAREIGGEPGDVVRDQRADLLERETTLHALQIGPAGRTF